MAGAGQSVLADPAPVGSLRPVLRPGSAVAAAPAGVEALVKTAGLGGRICYVVADAVSGQVLESSNPDIGMPPASVTKVMTAQYALEALGGGHRFATRLVAIGTLTNGRLNGDLVLLGGGDPLLNTNALAEMAASLKAAGLREVTGRFLVHGGDLPRVSEIDAGQPVYAGYNPAVAGLNLNFNRVHFEWKRVEGGFSVTMDARSAKYRPEVALTRMKIVDRKSPVYTFSNGGRTENWTVSRAALRKDGSRWLPVRQPELYAGEVFQILARAHGIVLKRPELSRKAVRGSVLASRQSQPLEHIMKGMLAKSNNLTAEVVGMSASVARGTKVTGLADSAAMMSRWMSSDLGAGQSLIVDHSGLGDKTRLSAADTVSALVRIGPDSALGAMLKLIDLRNDDKTKRLAVGRQLNAKTGSLNFVSGLAGFINGHTHRDLVFAIYAADMPRRTALSEVERERPPGARSWGRRARRLQWGLIERWSVLYG